nr:uncharacterized protein LOC129282809 [Lytechinus pictus]
MPVQKHFNISLIRVHTFLFIEDDNYDVTFTVEATFEGIATPLTSSITVRFAPSNLVATIKGASRKSVGVDVGPVSLDGSLSYDPDIPRNEDQSSGLTYLWTCVQGADQLCINAQDGSAFPPAADSTSAVLNANANYMVAGETYTLTLEVSSGSRRASTSVVIEALAGTPPPVTLAIPVLRFLSLSSTDAVPLVTVIGDRTRPVTDINSISTFWRLLVDDDEDVGYEFDTGILVERSFGIIQRSEIAAGDLDPGQLYNVQVEVDYGQSLKTGPTCYTLNQTPDWRVVLRPSIITTLLMRKDIAGIVALSVVQDNNFARIISQYIFFTENILLLEFEEGVRIDGTLDCSTIFELPSDRNILGTGSTCTLFRRARFIKITLGTLDVCGQTGLITTADTLTVRGDVILGLSDFSRALPETILEVNVENAITLDVVLSGRHMISSCGRVNINAGRTKKNGLNCRPLNYIWSVQSDGDVSAALSAAVTRNNSGVLDIDGSLLTEDQAYEFTLEVGTYLGTYQSEPFSVTRSAEAVPDISILPPDIDLENVPLSKRYTLWTCGDGTGDCQGILVQTNQYATGVDPYSTDNDDRDNLASSILEITLYDQWSENLDVVEVGSLTEPISINMHLSAPEPERSYECAFWDNTTNQWSRTGVETVMTTTTSVECRTSHLSVFAVFAGEEIVPTSGPSPVRGTKLGIIIGCVVGGLVVIVIIVILIVVCTSKSKKVGSTDKEMGIQLTHGGTNGSGNEHAYDNPQKSGPPPLSM